MQRRGSRPQKGSINMRRLFLIESSPAAIRHSHLNSMKKDRCPSQEPASVQLAQRPGKREEAKEDEHRYARHQRQGVVGGNVTR